jgi:hypothetical protein
MLTTPFSQLSQHAILVVVRVDRTVCVLRVASQASAVVNRVYSTPPAIADVNGYVTMAVTKLTSGT